MSPAPAECLVALFTARSFFPMLEVTITVHVCKQEGQSTVYARYVCERCQVKVTVIFQGLTVTTGITKELVVQVGVKHALTAPVAPITYIGRDMSFDRPGQLHM